MLRLALTLIETDHYIKIAVAELLRITQCTDQLIAARQRGALTQLIRVGYLRHGRGCIQIAREQQTILPAADEVAHRVWREVFLGIGVSLQAAEFQASLQFLSHASYTPLPLPSNS